MWGTSPYPHRCSKQAATNNFTPVLAPTCFNLLPSTLNFIFLMKCHLLTSGRIIIKRNGHKAVLCRKPPCQLAPLLNLGEEGSTVILCSRLLEYPKPVLRGNMAQTTPSKSLALSLPCSSGKSRLLLLLPLLCRQQLGPWDLHDDPDQLLVTREAPCNDSAADEKDKMAGKKV